MDEERCKVCEMKIYKTVEEQEGQLMIYHDERINRFVSPKNYEKVNGVVPRADFDVCLCDRALNFNFEKYMTDKDHRFNYSKFYLEVFRKERLRNESKDRQA